MAETGIVTTSKDLKNRLAAPGMIREDVMNKIWDISKIPLPFTDMVSTGTSKQSYTEWVQDSLASPCDIDSSFTANAYNDGQTITPTSTPTGTRVGNHHQIMVKTVNVSYRSDASDTIGRSKELAYQLMRKQQELRRDVEFTLMINQASVAETNNTDGTTPPKLGGLPSWLATNYATVGTGAQAGSAGGFNTSTKLTVAATPATTAGALTEKALRDMVEKVYTQGGDAGFMMTVPGLVSRFSEFMIKTGAAHANIQTEVMQEAKAATAIGAVNVFVTDFGTLRVIPNRLQPRYTGTSNTPVVDGTRADIFILDPSYLEIAYLQGYKTQEWSKVSLSERRVLFVDLTLKVLTEKAHGIIRDVAIATAMTAT